MNKYMYHFWKWGFLALLSIFLAGGIYVTFKASRPIQQVDDQVVRSSNQYDRIPIKLKKNQINDLSAAYLSQFQKDEDFNYEFKIGQCYAILSGETEILGKKIQFALTMIPKVTKSGNIKLKAHGLTVGTLNLSAKIVLKYISRNYQLPKWVSIDGDEALLRLNQIKTTNKVSFQAKTIDIDKNDFQFIINVPKANN
ncbi:YpmS family protein [Pediococcus pentosaceus]|uniref:YpmS family protein n=1 Tax=Pediococcus pentosaceus TaxID=1255 RepID=UPI00077CA794|nr:YpmS family protein [Pediococcus pentosaceus]UQB00038.1 YpmS family protein [Pediococcus pentosaceus]UQB01881.1 YpmS family protein [Pediococcus pentosaceus]